MDLTNVERCGMVLENINRIELIDHRSDNPGRKFVKYDNRMSVEIVLQDDGKTVKIFILPKEALDKNENV